MSGIYLVVGTSGEFESKKILPAERIHASSASSAAQQYGHAHEADLIYSQELDHLYRFRPALAVTEIGSPKPLPASEATSD